MRRLIVVFFILSNTFLFTSCSNPYLFYTGQPVTALQTVTQRIVVQFDAEFDNFNASSVLSRLNEDIYRWGRVRLVRSVRQDAYVLRVRLHKGTTIEFLDYIKTLSYVRFANVDHTLRV